MGDLHRALSRIPNTGKFCIYLSCPIILFLRRILFFQSHWSIIDFIKKKTWQLMVPYALFSLLKLIFYTIQMNLGFPEVVSVAKSLVFGIRNTQYVGSLWFIPSLYVMIIFDYTISKLFGNKKINLVISVGTFIISQVTLVHNPIVEPSWVFNIDSAMYYYLFYTVGNALFPLLNKGIEKTSEKVIQAILIVISVSIAGAAYLFGVPWIMEHIISILPFINSNILFLDVFYLLFIFAIIFVNISVAKLFQKSDFMSNIGKETLILCGTEEILKISIVQILQVFGIPVILSSPFTIIAYSLFCLAISYLTVTRTLNRYFPHLVGKPVPANQRLPA